MTEYSEVTLTLSMTLTPNWNCMSKKSLNGTIAHLKHESLPSTPKNNMSKKKNNDYNVEI